MSSSRSPALEVELKADGRVLLLVVGVGIAGIALIAVWAPTGLAAAPGIGLTLLILAWFIRAQLGPGGGCRVSRLRVDGDEWMLICADGQRPAIVLSGSTGRLGGWWFLHWAGGCAVITQSSIGVPAWRRLTARLRDAGGPAAPRGASRTG